MESFCPPCMLLCDKGITIAEGELFRDIENGDILSSIPTNNPEPRLFLSPRSTVQQAFKRLAVAAFVTDHFMYGFVDGAAARFPWRAWPARTCRWWRKLHRMKDAGGVGERIIERRQSSVRSKSEHPFRFPKVQCGFCKTVCRGDYTAVSPSVICWKKSAFQISKTEMSRING